MASRSFDGATGIATGERYTVSGTGRTFGPSNWLRTMKYLCGSNSFELSWADAGSLLRNAYIQGSVSVPLPRGARGKAPALAA